MRGAKLAYLVSVSDLLGAGVPPLKPLSWQKEVPGGTSKPLQGSFPRAGLKADWLKLATIPFWSYGFGKSDQRRPRSRVTFGWTFQESEAYASRSFQRAAARGCVLV